MTAQIELYDPASDNTLGGRISLARAASKLTLGQAALLLGVETSTWNAWECDSAAARSNRLVTMAGILGVSPIWLMTGIGAEPKEQAAQDEPETLLQRLKTASAEAALTQLRVTHLLAQLEHRHQVSNSIAI